MDDECDDHDGWYSDEGAEKLASDTETEVCGDQTLCTAPAIDSDNSAEFWEWQMSYGSYLPFHTLNTDFSYFYTYEVRFWIWSVAFVLYIFEVLFIEYKGF